MLIAILIVCIVLGAVFTILWLNNLLGTKGNKPSSVMPADQSLVKLPDSFDIQTLRTDLERLADTPTLFEQYVARARRRFTKASQIKTLEQWIQFYEIGQRTLAAKTAFTRAAIDDRQLEAEEKISLEAKDTELARLQADKEEHITRRSKAIRQREQIEEAALKGKEKSEDDLRMEAAQEYDRRTIVFDIRLKAGKKLTTLKELQRWWNEERKKIFNDDTLTSDEQDEQYAQLRESFNEYKRQLREDTDIYEE